jgi:hypothetical protein
LIEVDISSAAAAAVSKLMEASLEPLTAPSERVIRRRQKRPGRILHRRSALPDGVENVLDPCAEIGDRRIDHATAFLALAKRVPLAFGKKLIGHVGMRRDPAAARHRPADQRNGPSVLDLDRLGLGPACSHLTQAIRNVLIGIAGERRGRNTMREKFAQRRSEVRQFGIQVVHLGVALVAEHKPRRAVEHAQALRHVIERGLHRAVLRAALRDHEQTGKRRGAERERRGNQDGRDRSRSGRQRVDHPLAAQKREGREAAGKTDRSRENNKPPVAACLR